MPASKPIPREADGTVDIKQARKRMAGHRTNAEMEGKSQKRGAGQGAETHHGSQVSARRLWRQNTGLTAKKLVALHIFSDLDYDMLARYFIARAAWQNAQNWAKPPR